MDNAFIADGVIALILIAGALIGAKRGLIKSLMGVFVIVGALAGALVLANMLTDPITDLLAPRVEAKVMQRFSDELERIEYGAPDAESDGKLPERYGLPAEMFDELLNAVGGALSDARSAAKEKLTEQFRGAVSSGVHAVVRGTVQMVLVLVGFLALTIVLSLLARMLDRVFDLPLLNLTNSVGGAIMGLLEAGALIFVLLFFASRFGVTAITDCADKSRLMPLFMLRESIGILPALNGSV